jgi:hypothetical protein
MTFVRLLLLLGFLAAFADKGAGVDPNGGFRVTGDEGNGLDPHGRPLRTDEGNGIDPHGGR